MIDDIDIDSADRGGEFTVVQLEGELLSAVFIVADSGGLDGVGDLFVNRIDGLIDFGAAGHILGAGQSIL